MPVNSAIAADSRTIKLEVEQVVRIEPEGRSILTQRSFSKEVRKRTVKESNHLCANPYFQGDALSKLCSVGGHGATSVAVLQTVRCR